MITVKAAQDDGRIVLWEIHPDHESDANPTGEVWISGNGREHEVGETTQVKRLIAGGQLVKVESTKRAQVAPATPKPQAEETKPNRFSTTDKPQKSTGKAD